MDGELKVIPLTAFEKHPLTKCNKKNWFKIKGILR